MFHGLLAGMLIEASMNHDIEAAKCAAQDEVAKAQAYMFKQLARPEMLSACNRCGVYGSGCDCITLAITKD